MALETGTYISDLVVTNPANADNAANGADHLRLLKSTLKNTFPNINGAVTLTDEQINALATAAFVPSGLISMWSGSIATIPAGWLLCDGTSGTPDLRDRFIIGARQDNAGVSNTNVTGSLTKSGGSKDAIAVSHSHTLGAASVASGGAHTHGVTDPGHTHSALVLNSNAVAGGNNYYSLNGGSGLATGGMIGSSSTGISIQSSGAHTHSLSGSTDSAGSSGTDANLPPYFALAFIMKS